ncbi:MAG: M23 family metallopeptidase [Chlorobium sp.]|jgi:murein DD-endopeptidase MepM/ murein hydrolase activator NlpD|nr:M23 family metallopeptidase [Chlorobium sp.]
MDTTNRFISAYKYGRMVKSSSFTRLFAGQFFLAFFLFSSLFCIPVSLLAEDNTPVEAKNAAPANTTEGLLATTEQMIEQLILQIESSKSNSTDSRELTENPNPTPFFSSIPNIKPVNGSITSTFGRRLHPIYNITLFHSGIDFSASEGTRVHSTGDGIVAFSGYDKGYGQKVIINHGYGYKTIYAHLSKSLVRQGQKIKRAEIIALSGNTGVSTGPHLHYEVQKDNIKVNPTAYFFDENNPDKFITNQKASPEQSGDNS